MNASEVTKGNWIARNTCLHIFGDGVRPFLKWVWEILIGVTGDKVANGTFTFSYIVFVYTKVSVQGLDMELQCHSWLINIFHNVTICVLVSLCLNFHYRSWNDMFGLLFSNWSLSFIICRLDTPLRSLWSIMFCTT